MIYKDRPFFVLCYFPVSDTNFQFTISLPIGTAIALLQATTATISALVFIAITTSSTKQREQRQLKRRSIRTPMLSKLKSRNSLR